MFPSVTGKMFPKSICDTETSAPYNIPCGIKNMFAIECSNPMVTNAVIGQKMAKILPATLVVAIVPHTAKHTNQLHNTPLKNATMNGKVVAFIVAIAIAGAGFAADVIAVYAMYAKNTDPAKFPAYDTSQFFITCACVTFFDNKPLNITNTFPVNNSAPVKMTMVKPKGNPNAPLTRFESPGFEAANAGDEPPTVVNNNPPKPMSAPAVKLNANVDKVSALAFFSDVATAAANVSGGVFASDARTMSCLPLLFLTDGDVIIALLLGIIARRLMNAFLEDEEEIDRFAENDKNFALLSLEEEEEEEEEEDARAETLAAAAMVVLVLANIVLSIDIDMY
jgi:hypothetical protein